MTSELKQVKAACHDDDRNGAENMTRDDDEKTIPFLRRLTDMLQENDEVISFCPGNRKNGHVNLGKIVVHDRARVEAEVLPRYFNHASFASLRRQLNYFSFTRIGKGRQRGATYCNEDVVELNDVLRLKRRSVGTNVLPVHEIERSTQDSDETFDEVQENDIADRSSTIINSVVPVVHLPSNKRARSTESLRFLKAKKPRKSKSHASIITPISSSPVQHQTDEEEDQQRIVLDLTIPSTKSGGSFLLHRRNRSCASTKKALQSCDVHGSNDDDILAGCNALLSFSNGFSKPMAKTTRA